MHTIERSIDIDAPPQKVWGVLSDFSNWKKSHDDYVQAFDRLLRDLKAEEDASVKPD